MIRVFPVENVIRVLLVENAASILWLYVENVMRVLSVQNVIPVFWLSVDNECCQSRM